MIYKMTLSNMCIKAALALLCSFVQVISSQSDADAAGPSNRLAHNPFLPPQQSIDPQSIFPYPIVDGDIIFPENAPRYTEQNPHWEIYDNRHLGTPNVSNKLEPVAPEEQLTDHLGDQPQPLPGDTPITRIPNYPTTIPPRPTQPQTTTTTTAPIQLPTTPPVGAYELVSCPKESEAFDRSTKECYHLASQGPCTKDQWWVLDKQTNLPECRSRPCPPFYSKSPVTQKCILGQDAEKTGTCRVRENLANNVYGEPECKCFERNYRWTDGLCYPTYQRGPCMLGYYLLYNQQTRTVSCEHNECNMDGYVLVDGICNELGAICGEHGEKNIYINPHDGIVGCYDFFRLPISQSKV